MVIFLINYLVEPQKLVSENYATFSVGAQKNPKGKLNKLDFRFFEISEFVNLRSQ